MLLRSVVFVAFLGLSAASYRVQSPEEGSRVGPSTNYYGPPAPLNKDGTVALTQEVQQARAEHEAAIAAELKRLEDAKRLAAAHPDLTSPPDQGWRAHSDYIPQPYNHGKGGFSSTSGYFNQGSSYDKVNSQYNQGPSHSPKTYMPAPLNTDGTVALTPEVQQAKAAHDAEFKRLMEASSLAMAHPDLTSPKEHAAEHYDQGSHSDQGPTRSLVHSKNPDAGMPAPLNPDGTVAQTAAYKAIASSLNAEYQKVLHNIKHQHVDAHFQNRAAEGYAY